MDSLSQAHDIHVNNNNEQEQKKREPHQIHQVQTLQIPHQLSQDSFPFYQHHQAQLFQPHIQKKSPEKQTNQLRYYQRQLQKQKNCQQNYQHQPQQSSQRNPLQSLHVPLSSQQHIMQKLRDSDNFDSLKANAMKTTAEIFIPTAIPVRNITSTTPQPHTTLENLSRSSSVPHSTLSRSESSPMSHRLSMQETFVTELPLPYVGDLSLHSIINEWHDWQRKQCLKKCAPDSCAAQTTVDDARVIDCLHKLQPFIKCQTDGCEQQNLCTNRDRVSRSSSVFSGSSNNSSASKASTNSNQFTRQVVLFWAIVKSEVDKLNSITEMRLQQLKASLNVLQASYLRRSQQIEIAQSSTDRLACMIAGSLANFCIILALVAQFDVLMSSQQLLPYKMDLRRQNFVNRGAFDSLRAAFMPFDPRVMPMCSMCHERTHLAFAAVCGHAACAWCLIDATNPNFCSSCGAVLRPSALRIAFRARHVEDDVLVARTISSSNPEEHTRITNALPSVSSLHIPMFPSFEFQQQQQRLITQQSSFGSDLPISRKRSATVLQPRSDSKVASHVLPTFEEDNSMNIDKKRGHSCHQCKCSKLESDILHCHAKYEDRVNLPGLVRKRRSRCRKSYCSVCLKRYNVNFAEIKRNSLTESSWKCMSCMGTCDCAACIRARCSLNYEATVAATSSQQNNVLKQSSLPLNDYALTQRSEASNHKLAKSKISHNSSMASSYSSFMPNVSGTEQESFAAKQLLSSMLSNASFMESLGVRVSGDKSRNALRLINALVSLSQHSFPQQSSLSTRQHDAFSMNKEPSLNYIPLMQSAEWHSALSQATNSTSSSSYLPFPLSLDSQHEQISNDLSASTDVSLYTMEAHPLLDTSNSVLNFNMPVSNIAAWPVGDQQNNLIAQTRSSDLLQGSEAFASSSLSCSGTSTAVPRATSIEILSSSSPRTCSSLTEDSIESSKYLTVLSERSPKLHHLAEAAGIVCTGASASA